jgi:glutaredoxin
MSSLWLFGAGILYILGNPEAALFVFMIFLYMTFKENFTNSNINVVIYKSDTCPYCLQAMEITRRLTSNYKFIDMSEINPQDQLYQSVSNLNYVPKIFIDNSFIGSLGEYRTYISKQFPNFKI